MTTTGPDPRLADAAAGALHGSASGLVAFGPSEADLRQAAGDGEGANEIVKLWLDTKREVEEAMRPFLWADDEIRKAQAAYPASAARLFHAMPLLRWACGGPVNETLYRGHFRELLERVAAGTDTRPGTAAEICMVMRNTSMHVPLPTEATGLYMRAWRQAGMPMWPFDGSRGGGDPDVSYAEKVFGVDDLDREVRTMIGRRAGWRRITPDTATPCEGLHYGEPAPDRPYGPSSPIRPAKGKPAAGPPGPARRRGPGDAPAPPGPPLTRRPPGWPPRSPSCSPASANPARAGACRATLA